MLLLLIADSIDVDVVEGSAKQILGLIFLLASQVARHEAAKKADGSSSLFPLLMSFFLMLRII